MAAALLAACGGAGLAFGQTDEGLEERKEYQEFYEKQSKKTSFFGAAPSHHITPKRDNIAFALEAKTADVTIAPETAEAPSDFSDLDHRLEMTGYSVFPLVGFSAERFGVGFMGEVGSRQIKFLSRTADTSSAQGSFYEQFSDTSYSGAGIYAFALLPQAWAPPWLTGTLILGGRNLAATYETNGTRTDSTTVPDATKLKYDVNSFDLGLNLAATLSKRFIVNPWFNYRKTQLGAVKDHNGNAADDLLTVDLEQQVTLDRELMWLSQPTFTYGIDFAVQIQKFQIHLGGLFGYLVSMNRGADRLQDKSIDVAVSYDLKAK